MVVNKSIIGLVYLALCLLTAALPMFVIVVRLDNRLVPSVNKSPTFSETQGNDMMAPRDGTLIAGSRDVQIT